MSTAELVWDGPEDLRAWLAPVEMLTRHPQNPRRGQVKMIEESLSRFGQVRPILVDVSGTIVAGNHTYLAAVALGWTHVAAVRNTFESPEEARAYLVADNRIPELGRYESDQLLALLEDIETVDGWAGTGYSADDLEDLRALQGQIATTDPVEFTGAFAVSDEELAERQATLAGGRALSEVVLLLTSAQNADFDTHTRILGKHYESSGVTDTVLRAVAEAASREA